MVYIGMTKNLLAYIGGKIHHADAKCPPYGDCKLAPKAPCKLSNAEKEALAQGRRLEVSWAELSSPGSAACHKATLLHAYKDIHGRLPGIMGRDGKWVPGVKVLPKIKGPVGDLDWQGWYPMEHATVALIPKGPGVMRMRAE